MNEKQAKSLKVGQRITFRDDVVADSKDNGEMGTVTDILYSGFNVKWDDGVTIGYKFILADNLHPVR